jgi:heavy metal translocating P-type ATPase
MLLELALAGAGALFIIKKQARKERLKRFLKPQAPTPPDSRPPAQNHSPAEHTYAGRELQWSNRRFTLSALSLSVSTVGDAFYPPLSLLSVPGMLYATRELYQNGFQSLVQGKKVTVDLLLISVNLICFLYGYLFLFCLNSSIFLWTRHLLDKVKQDSRADYTDIFRQQARTVWVRVDGVDIETPLDALQVNDLVIITAGQTIPVDGHIAEGAATIDQHMLTGEAAPAEKGVGDAVFALTVVLSGRIGIRVEKTGEATAVAHIARLLNNTVAFKTGRQLWAERIADQLVWPTFISGLAALPLLGPSAAAALLDAHPKYKTTLATSLGILNYFKLAARQGVLIKDGRTLELLHAVDTVVFDKTGTLTLEQPHVGRIYPSPPYTAEEILRLAAAAEQHQSHPIAKAIVQAAQTRELPIPPLNGAAYRVGYGLTVSIDARTVHVGSLRFLEMEEIAIPPEVRDTQAQCHSQGHSLVLVAIGGQVAGAIELHATIRPEAQRIIQGLRQRNLKAIYIISGDHEAPTRRLAEALGIDHYVAETLPEDKAALIDQLQKEGKVLCYVGDGINDSIALKKSHVSVSLHGASTLATDTAEVILMDESLNQLCRLFDVAREFNANMNLTLAAVFAPSILCVGGVLLFNLGFWHARLFNVIGLLTGVGVAMLPLLTDRTAPLHPDQVVSRPTVDMSRPLSDSDHGTPSVQPESPLPAYSAR